MLGKKYNYLVLVSLIALAGRLLPHLPNMTPMLAMSVVFARNNSRMTALLWLAGVLLISNLALSLLYHYSLWGDWFITSYSAYFLIVLAMPWLAKLKGVYLILTASLAYWIFTNLGVWLFSGIYPLTMAGFLQCYWLGIPFLSTALLGDLAWFSLFSYSMVRQRQIMVVSGR